MYDIENPGTVDHQSRYAYDDEGVDEKSNIEQISNDHEFQRESDIGYTQWHTSPDSIEEFEIF